MKKMIQQYGRIRQLLLALSLLFADIAASAQDVQFSQFFEAPLLRNPSLAGIFNGDMRVQGIYRSQWGAVAVPYRTGVLNLEYKQPIGSGDDFITAGLHALYDRAGSADFTTTQLMPVLNYHKAISGSRNKYLSLGFMAGWVQRRLDMTKVSTDNQYGTNGYDPSISHGETFIKPVFSYLDASVGLSYNSDVGSEQSGNYFIGVAYHHFNRPKNSFYKKNPDELHPKWVGSAGIRMVINEQSFFTVHGDYVKQGGAEQVTAGAIYSYKLGTDYDNPEYIIHLGAMLRFRDAVIPVVKIEFVPFSVALSYDINVSQLRTSTQGKGGFELSVSYSGFFDRDNSTKNAILCPRF